MRIHALLLALALAGCAGDPVDSTRAAIGGGMVSTNPSVVFVYSTSGESCSGTVVGPSHVLTDGICVYADATLEPPGNLGVFVGADTRRVDAMHEVQAIELSAPEPPDGTHQPVAILITATPLGLPVLPIAETDPAVDDEVTMVGYGATESGASGTKNEGVANVVTVTPEVITAEGAAGVCSGDAGGPAIDASGAVVGIGNFAYGADGMSTPTCPSGSGFVNAVTLRTWIADTVAAELPDAGVTMDDAGVAAEDAGTSADAGAGVDAGAGGGGDAGCACRASACRRGAAAPLVLGLLGLLVLAGRRR